MFFTENKTDHILKALWKVQGAIYICKDVMVDAESFFPKCMNKEMNTLTKKDGNKEATL